MNYVQQKEVHLFSNCRAPAPIAKLKSSTNLDSVQEPEASLQPVEELNSEAPAETQEQQGTQEQGEEELPAEIDELYF